MISVRDTPAMARRRRAGTVVLVLGGLNLVAGLIVTLAGAGLVGIIALVAGVGVTGLGWWLRRGARTAAVIAVVVFGGLAALQVVLLVAQPDVMTMVRLALTALILATVARAVPDE